MMKEDYNLDKMIAGTEKHYSDKKFLNKIANFGGGLGEKVLHAAATLYVALKSKDMPKSSKFVVLGALGYFILPFDLIADFLPLAGLTDDTFVIMAALAKVYMSITDDMKIEAQDLLDRKLGNEVTSNE